MNHQHRRDTPGRGHRGGGYRDGGYRGRGGRRDQPYKGHEGARHPEINVEPGPIQVEANFFKMNIENGYKVFRYTVKLLVFHEKDGKWIDKAPTNRIQFNRAALSYCINECEKGLATHLAYDGRSTAYSLAGREKKFGGLTHQVLVNRDGRRPRGGDPEHRNLKVRLEIEIDEPLRFVQNSEESTLKAEVLSALNIIMAKRALDGRYVAHKNCFYDGQRCEALGRNRRAEAWGGIFQSLRPCEEGFLLNVDVSFSAFWKYGGMSLQDAVTEVCGKPWHTTETGDLRSCFDKLRGLKVRAIHNQIVYTVDGISRESALTYRFRANDEDPSSETSIRDYLRAQYQIELRCPEFAVVKLKSGSSALPLELLCVEKNQIYKKALDPEEQADMVSKAAKPPGALFPEIVNYVTRSNSLNFGFGLTSKTETVKVQGRVLMSPTIEYLGGLFPLACGSGSWLPARGKHKFMKPQNLTSWAVVLLDRYRDGTANVSRFIRTIAEAGENMGMKISQPSTYSYDSLTGADMKAKFCGLARRQARLQLIMVLKASNESKNYNEIKSVGDVDLGIATQVCVLDDYKLKKVKYPYCANVILKINLKLGGVNLKVRPPYYGSNRVRDTSSFLLKPYIVLGADVNHPSPGEDCESVAALVAGVGPDSEPQASTTRALASRKEVFEEIGSMFEDVYKIWKECRRDGQHTSAIIMFRDGVSESQYQEVLEKEVAALRGECQARIPGRVKITYVIVTKRHHSRFRVMNGGGNLPPGTVIDRKVVGKEYCEFYLNSHKGIQGTNKPAKYTILLDENQIPVDELQEYIYARAHRFSRCPRAVSIPDVTLCAHWRATRGQQYMDAKRSKSAGRERGGNPIRVNMLNNALRYTPHYL